MPPSHRFHTSRGRYRPAHRKGPSKTGAASDRSTRLPRNAAPIEVTIEKIGSRGDGVGTVQTPHSAYQGRMVFVPHTITGETVLARPVSETSQGIRAELLELLSASPDRRLPRCDVFSDCGGCQFQHLSPSAYRNWKQSYLETLFQRNGLETENFAPPFWAGEHERRRAKFTWRRTSEGLVLGFLARGSHYIVPVTGCTILESRLKDCLPRLQHWLMTHMTPAQTGHIHINMLDDGPDIVLSTDMPLSPSQIAGLGMDAAGLSASRVSLIEQELDIPAPLYAEGRAILSSFGTDVSPPPGGFLQSCLSAEQVMREEVENAVSEADNILDLFCGCGTFSLGLAGQGKQIKGIDSDAPSINSFIQAARHAGCGQNVSAETRNLFDTPLMADDMAGYDAVIIDPPRQGATAQIEQIMRSSIHTIAMVSCNPHSLCRDLLPLMQAGFHLRRVRMIDQFVWSTHIETIAIVSR